MLRQSLAILLVTAATFVSALAVVALWANQQLGDNNTFTQTVTTTLRQPAVQESIANDIVNQIYLKVDVPSLVKLPAPFESFSSLASEGLKGPLATIIVKVLNSEQVLAVEETAVRGAHQSLVGAPSGQPTLLIIKDQTVSLDLSQAALIALDQIGLRSQGQKIIPASVGQIRLLSSPKIAQSRQFLALLDVMAAWLLPLALVLALLGVICARRRSFAIIGLGAGLMIACAGLLITTDLVPSYLETNLRGTSAIVAQSVWQQAFKSLSDMIYTLASLAVALFIGGILLSPPARLIRNYLSLLFTNKLYFVPEIIIIGALLIWLSWPAALLVALFLIALRYQCHTENLPQPDLKTKVQRRLSRLMVAWGGLSNETRASNQSFVVWLTEKRARKTNSKTSASKKSSASSPATNTSERPEVIFNQSDAPHQTDEQYKQEIAKKPAAGAKKPAAAKKPTAAKKPAAAKKPTAAKKPAAGAKKPAAGARKPTAAKKPAAGAKKPTAAKKPAAP